MPEGNITNVNNFFIVCFPGLPPNYYGLVSAVMFCVFMCTLMVNGIFFLLYLKEKSLQKPMYFIMLNLAASDVLFSTTTLPKMIARYWFGDGTLSFAGCFIQMHFVHYFGSVNAFILGIIAFDRYVAICNPLRYANIVKESTILGLCLACWLLAEPTIFYMTFRATTLSYCASNKVTQCYCDHPFVTRLSCTDRTPNVFSAVVSAMVVLLTPLTFILFSYIAIIMTVFRTSSTRGRLKTLSTCSSQLLIITLYFLPRCLNYLAGYLGITYNTDVQILVILLYSLLPPLINPLIYCLKTKEICSQILKTLGPKPPLKGSHVQEAKWNHIGCCYHKPKQFLELLHTLGALREAASSPGSLRFQAEIEESAYWGWQD
ncbi:olfactory receptor 2AT4-like [Silurus meridionalis]|uniref:olfactory receptor 2AT4-like n=1 Tax=Silurus meridionalis TaxID=175797 RepID=UPI001EEBD124|nr:olfactory receptor 2AT4-like [Silurus meridionalis]